MVVDGGFTTHRVMKAWETVYYFDSMLWLCLPSLLSVKYLRSSRYLMICMLKCMDLVICVTYLCVHIQTTNASFTAMSDTLLRCGVSSSNHDSLLKSQVISSCMIVVQR